jgi:BirA family biotin operon repressor/biotin-[acetyl-CoA-carboxylase] ligase
MDIQYIKKVDSTHKYLKNYIKTNKPKKSICFYTFCQTDGIGSRNNEWVGQDGNLFFSFLILQKDLPYDLPLQSCSIYFSFILKEILSQAGSNIKLKWPNDFYIDDNKIGGTITNKIENYLICGIGLNIIPTKIFKAILDIDISKEKILEQYFFYLTKYPLWKQIFSKYKLEFHHNKKYFTHINGKKVSLEDAILNDDGTLTINNKKVFSLR